ncbi:hypothetical protein XaFJ1_GM002749 [Xanthomonas albilineans]|nr:hypothetical protein XaFJ1_GM002749 [Xanthomonas albilineans]
MRRVRVLWHAIGRVRLAQALMCMDTDTIATASSPTRPASAITSGRLR